MMATITNTIQRLHSDDSGQDLIEYALVAALIGYRPTGSDAVLRWWYQHSVFGDGFETDQRRRISALSTCCAGNLCRALQSGRGLRMKSNNSPIRRTQVKANFLRTLRNLHNDESGQDLIEYALVAALIALGATTSLGVIGTEVSKAFSKIASQMTSSIG
jgi:pilus assembly protein Flp/PilA